MRYLLSIFEAFCCAISVMAQDPIIQTNYTADPAPLVYNDTIFLYTSHDEDDATDFKMLDWLLYTSTDMVNWTDHGAVAGLENFAWRSRDNGAWAQQVVPRNGKFYMYCPLHGHGIGVLVADSPYGPFKDPIGKPLVWQQEHWSDIDPTVFIDQDGQAYMYWGNPNLYMIRLNEDMISTEGEIVQHPKIEDYQEGPWFWRRGDNYYLAFASTCCPEGIGYAMSKSPTGPWEYKGHIMNHTERTRGNHPGIIDYKGKTYIFGQNSDLLKIETPVYMERRSISAAEMHYNEDGTIEELPYWKDTRLEQIEAFDPYRRVEGETMAWGYRFKTAPMDDSERYPCSRKGRYLTDIDQNEYLLIRGVDFGAEGASIFKAMTRSSKTNSEIVLRIDSPQGFTIGRLAVPQSDDWTLSTTELDSPTSVGIHDLYICFHGEGSNLLDLDYWEMEK